MGRLLLFAISVGFSSLTAGCGDEPPPPCAHTQWRWVAVSGEAEVELALVDAVSVITASGQEHFAGEVLEWSNGGSRQGLLGQPDGDCAMVGGDFDWASFVVAFAPAVEQQRWRYVIVHAAACDAAAGFYSVELLASDQDAHRMTFGHAYTGSSKLAVHAECTDGDRGTVEPVAR